MEKHKFKFQKLELPNFITTESEPLPEIRESNIFTSKNQQKKQYSYIYMAFITAICLMCVYYTYVKKSSNTQKIAISPKKLIKNTFSTQKNLTTPTADIEMPTYYNFYDSFVFLNKVKGTKIVVSKGFDDYIKKKKLIVKANGFYYNLFCEDLIDNYAVGDSIP